MREPPQSAAAACFSQKVTLSFRNTPLPKVLDAISKQTGMSIVFKDNLLKDAQPVTIDVKDVRIEDALKECLKDQPSIPRPFLSTTPNPSAAELLSWKEKAYQRKLQYSTITMRKIKCRYIQINE